MDTTEMRPDLASNDEDPIKRLGSVARKLAELGPASPLTSSMGDKITAAVAAAEIAQREVKRVQAEAEATGRLREAAGAKVAALLTAARQAVLAGVRQRPKDPPPEPSS